MLVTFTEIFYTTKQSRSHISIETALKSGIFCPNSYLSWLCKWAMQDEPVILGEFHRCKILILKPQFILGNWPSHNCIGGYVSMGMSYLSLYRILYVCTYTMCATKEKRTVTSRTRIQPEHYETHNIRRWSCSKLLAIHKLNCSYTRFTCPILRTAIE